MSGQPLRPMRAGATIYPGNTPEHRQRRYCIYYQPNDEVARKVYVHNNCHCNEMVALRNRVLFECPKIIPQRLAQCKTLARLIADWLPRNIEPQDWISAYSGRKRRKYEEAVASLASTPVKRSDSYVAAFVKAEKIFELKDPRLIQARSARYNVELANYLKPIEHALYNIKGTGRLRDYLPPSRVIAKGCNMERRAGLLKKKMQRFANPLVVSLDASRFDAHVNEILEAEHLIYKRYWGSPHLQRLLDWQCRNRGRTSGGIRYRCTYGRMSGDMNTALGNCLISVMVLMNIMRRLHLSPRKWDMLCDGDDTLLIIDQSSAHILQHIPDLYLEHGFVIKVENVTTDYHQVRFCQSYPVQTVMGPKMVSDPTRVLSRSLVGVKHWAEDKYVPKYLTLIGFCELALNMGVPVLQEYALMILSWGSGLPKRIQLTGRVIKAMREERRHEIRPLPITPEARDTFERATGMTVEHQRSLECCFRALNRYATQKEKSYTTDQPPSWPEVCTLQHPANTANQAQERLRSSPYALHSRVT